MGFIFALLADHRSLQLSVRESVSLHCLQVHGGGVLQGSLKDARPGA